MGKTFLLGLGLVLLASGSSTVMAGLDMTELRVCARPVNHSRWFPATGIMVDGSELNLESGSFDYDSFARYLTLHWGFNQQARFVLEAFDEPSFYPRKYRDDQGRLWELKSGWERCY